MAEAFFGEPFRRIFWSSRAAPLDWMETPSAHLIKIDVPGLGREDVKVHLEEGNILHIKAEPSAAAREEKDTVWHIAERRQSEFERRFAIPEGIRADHIKAVVENGVLTLVLPKEPVPPKSKPRTIHVSSKL